MKPISPMSHVNETARRNSAYWLLSGILPHFSGPTSLAPLNMKTSITMQETSTNRVEATCGTLDATL